MADVKIYVEVHNFAVKDIFESKHKSRLIALMKKTAEKAIKDKLALGAPKDKGGEGYTLDGSLTSLAPDKAQKMLQAKCSISISSGRGIESIAQGSVGVSIAGADKIKDGDIDATAQACVESAMKSAVKFMSSTPP
jgi:hypothetical protein